LFNKRCRLLQVSYVLVYSDATRKWRLVVQSGHPDHKEIIKEVFLRAQKEPLDKAACVALRDRLQKERKDGQREDGDEKLGCKTGDGVVSDRGGDLGSDSEGSDSEGSESEQTSTPSPTWWAGMEVP
jgi:hypothetical protein